MALNAEGKPFDAQIYLNEVGEEKRWPDEPKPETPDPNAPPPVEYPLRSYFSYSAWKAWYKGEAYEPLEEAPGAAPAAANVPA